jgi:hypothetical protein
VDVAHHFNPLTCVARSRTSAALLIYSELISICAYLPPAVATADETIAVMTAGYRLVTADAMIAATTAGDQRVMNAGPAARRVGSVNR